MKRISIAGLILCACSVPAASAQKTINCPPTVNWTEFHTIDMARWNPCETVLGVNNVGSLQLKWSYTTGGSVYSTPIVVNGVVYFGSFDHNVYALNASTGAVLWSFPTGDLIYSSVALANGVVYAGSMDGDLYALNARTGSLRWSYPTGPVNVGSPTVANGVVYVGGGSDGVLYALDAKTGALRWSSNPTCWYLESSPAV